MKYRLTDIAVFILSLALAAYCCYVVYSEYEGVAYWLTLVFVCMYVLANPLHEIGHMLFGAAVKIKAVPKKTFSLKASSFCKIIPKTDKNVKGRLIFTTLGGLAVNFLFVAIGTVSLFVPAVPSAISVVLPANFYIFVLNALPILTGGGKTDGFVFWELVKETDEAKVTLAVLTVQAQVLNGKSFEDVDENLLFGVPQIREDDQSFIALTELRYEYFKAKGDDEKAQFYKSRFDELQKEYL